MGLEHFGCDGEVQKYRGLPIAKKERAALAREQACARGAMQLRVRRINDRDRREVPFS